MHSISGGIEVRRCEGRRRLRWRWHLATTLDRFQGMDGRTSWEILVRKRFGGDWDPVAAERGLPDDISRELERYERRLYELDPASGGYPTWISWPELRDLDLTVAADGRYGELRIGRKPPPGSSDLGYALAAWSLADGGRWPAEYLERYGVPPGRPTPADAGSGRWIADELRREIAYYERNTRAEALGPGTGWPEVFTAMRELAADAGDEHVRLVVFFD